MCNIARYLTIKSQRTFKEKGFSETPQIPFISMMIMNQFRVFNLTEYDSAYNRENRKFKISEFSITTSIESSLSSN